MVYLQSNSTITSSWVVLGITRFNVYTRIPKVVRQLIVLNTLGRHVDGLCSHYAYLGYKTLALYLVVLEVNNFNVAC